jgi:transposase-like protein
VDSGLCRRLTGFIFRFLQRSLKSWLKPSGKSHTLALPTNSPATAWNAEQRLAALMDSHHLKDQALHAWCRTNGLFEHQLRQWQHEFCQPGKTAPTPMDAALRQAKQQNEKLQRELRRKDKALAEAAALLVLQKKFQSLWEAEEK